MGCTNTTDFPSDGANEEIVRVYQDSLGFSNVLASRLIEKVHAFSCSGRLNRQQFRSMMQAAGLYSDSMEDETNPALRFYNLLGDGRRIDSKKLAMLAVLLGKGTYDTKAGLLFDLYQTEKVIELPVVARMVQNACEIALKFLPEYAYLEVEALGDECSLRKLRTFQTKLAVAHRFVVTKIRDNLEFGHRRITLDALRRSKMLKFFLLPQDTRQLALQLFAKIPLERRCKETCCLPLKEIDNVDDTCDVHTPPCFNC